MNQQIVRPPSSSRRPATPAPQAHGWSREQIATLYDLPLMDLLHQAQQTHREHFDPNEVQISTLLSIKTGGCAEDCGYCAQSAHHDTGVAATRLMPVAEVVAAARAARAEGATRFCMGAAWRSPKDRDMARLTEMVREVRALGMQTCITLGMLTDDQAEALKQAGLDFYNHNLDTAPEYYDRIVSTRSYQDRLDTIDRVRTAGLQLCCGGILGMGETRAQRVSLMQQLAALDPYPESVPINHLIRVEGTPLQDAEPLDPIEFVRTVAVARITMPRARVRLSAGRQQMDDALQALCFLAGANSIFLGDKLLTAGNPLAEHDRELFARLGLKPSVAPSA
jgi:biotin synthase